MTTNHSRFSSLDTLRGVAIVMVVATHAIGYSELPKDTQATLATIVQTAAVPAFFFADGYLFAHKTLTEKVPYYSWRWIGKSAKRLLLPWLVFSIFYTGMRGIFEWMGLAREQIILHADPIAIVTAIYYSDVSSQMYFLPALFIARILYFPGCQLLTRGAVALGASQLIYTAMFHGLGITGMFASWMDPFLEALWGLQFSILGAFIRKLSAFKAVDCWRLLSAIGVLLLIAAAVAKYRIESVQYAYLLFLFLLSNIDFHPARHLGAVGRESMVIFLLHMPIIMNVVALGLRRWTERWPVLLFLLLVVVVTAVSYYVGRFIRKTLGLGIIFGESSNYLTAKH